MLKSNLAACELRFTGTGALNLKPAVFRPSPMVKSLAGYLAAAAASAETATGFMPTKGKMLLSWAVVSVWIEGVTVVPHVPAAVPGGHALYLSSPCPRLARGTVSRMELD